MKTIKGTFNYYFTHTHRGSHRSSDGFKYSYEDITGVRGPYFDQIVPLSYQDLIKLRNFASEVNSKYYNHVEDYELADCYTSNQSSDSNKDFGLCQFFNENYSQRYNIILIYGTLQECTIHIDEMPPLKSFIAAYNNAQASQNLNREEMQSEIIRITNRLTKLKDELKIINSPQTFQNTLLKELYASLKSNLHIFEPNEPFYSKLYPLDIAIFNHDEVLIDALIANGAYQYNSEFDSILSAKCGNFNKILDIISEKELSSIDILNIFNLIIALPDVEFYSLFKSKSDLIRNGRVLLSYFDKLRIYFSVKDYYVNHSSFDKDKEPIKIILVKLMKMKEYKKANFIYDFPNRMLFFTNFIEYDMLQLSFMYGNVEFIKRWDLWSLVHTITENYCYSYFYERLVPDSDGDILQLRWDFEPYVKPENIGQELYEQIINQIEKYN